MTGSAVAAVPGRTRLEVAAAAVPFCGGRAVSEDRAGCRDADPREVSLELKLVVCAVTVGVDPPDRALGLRFSTVRVFELEGGSSRVGGANEPLCEEDVERDAGAAASAFTLRADARSRSWRAEASSRSCRAAAAEEDVLVTVAVRCLIIS